MEDCLCCQHLLQQLKSHFRQANEQEFDQIWRSLTEAAGADPFQDHDLSLLVHFKLQVHFAVESLVLENQCDSMDRFALFLQQDGSRYSKFPQLAPFFALPYIRDNTEHPLIIDITKSEWIECLEMDWTELIQSRLHYGHNVSAQAMHRQANNYARLNDKYSKLRQDHKMLIDLASHLVTALEESLQGQTKFALETFEYYSQEIRHLTDYNGTNQEKGGHFQWEAPPMLKSSPTPSVDSENCN